MVSKLHQQMGWSIRESCATAIARRFHSPRTRRNCGLAQRLTTHASKYFSDFDERSSVLHEVFPNHDSLHRTAAFTEESVVICSFNCGALHRLHMAVLRPKTPTSDKRPVLRSAFYGPPSKARQHTGAAGKALSWQRCHAVNPQSRFAKRLGRRTALTPAFCFCAT